MLLETYLVSECRYGMVIFYCILKMRALSFVLANKESIYKFPWLTNIVFLH